jgi:hypothetical protein
MNQITTFKAHISVQKPIQCKNKTSVLPLVVMPFLWGHPGPWHPPPGGLSPGRGQWDSTSAAAALLPTACMTDIVFGYLGHMSKMPFSLVLIPFCK